MIVIANATILIGLAKINRFNLLKEIFQEIIIPEAIYKEVVIEGKGLPAAEETKNASWIKVQTVKNEALKEELLINLGKGEAEVIALAKEINADLVLLDDSLARKIATDKKLEVIGLIGILIEAKRRKLIKNVKDEFKKLMEEGMYYSDKFCNEILRKIGEL